MATSSEKFILRLKDFQDNIVSSFSGLRNDTNFTDVTLISEDGQQMHAHKVVLSLSSPFFMNILKIHKHPNPVVYLKGVKGNNLHSILDFLYYGVVDIYQNTLDGFFALAE